MQEASFYSKTTNCQVQCELCPWNCILSDGQTGNCKVRSNQNGVLLTEIYNKVAALGSDPIEKKPLYHFYPGKNILSVGEVGCNLHCSFCQNHRISQCRASEFSGFHNISAKKIVTEALKTWNNIGIAYTYNEPFTFYEFLLDTAELVQSKGLKNVVVSNGYINEKPLQKVLPFIDAFNIDLKAFSNDFYKKHTKGELQPVLNSLKEIAESPAHLEITTLIIPGLNDDISEFKNMVNWIASELGESVPLHLSRYYPQYKLSAPATPIETLIELYDLAKQHLQHVYLGNVSDTERSATYCPNCNTELIARNHYKTEITKIDTCGKCQKCGSTASIII
ncbi:AmmeMemoRadiSam system radical SAM enzyme [Draconibacterium sp. IB214405]|uniref:AmmeMemoRadiSam system radical SAM enzyme n=1 Tax=Draconibacterium sp. IB214405 TaxID=3097352 RepID=UPI002A1000E9|nr:AmmeMemoRadiSam system radical SAM enzyme [Draconibacterium sp. IB214405]MDX8338469.1 AmmeMemoRadiSam system radical SAM enzyme [Draconibacterium sp. IB214405]